MFHKKEKKISKFTMCPKCKREHLFLSCPVCKTEPLDETAEHKRLRNKLRKLKRKQHGKND